MRQRDVLPAAPEPRPTRGRHLGSTRAYGRTFGAASEQRRSDRTTAHKHLRRDQARARAHPDRVGRGATPISVCCASRTSTDQVSP